MDSIYGDEFKYILQEVNSIVCVKVIVSCSSNAIVEYPEEFIEYQSLPPFELTIELPFEYPTAPVKSIQLECSWLPTKEIEILKRELYQLIESCAPTDQILLFTLVEHLKTKEFTFLKAEQETWKELRAVLDEYHLKYKRRLLDGSVINCSVCMEEKTGRMCYEFSCGHVFCYACLVRSLKICIEETRIGDVGCLECSSSKKISPDEVCKIFKEAYDLRDVDFIVDEPNVTKKLCDRYAELVKKDELSRRSDVVWCPRETCGREYFIKSKEALVGEVCICKYCTLAFCSLCLRTWHGNQFKCKPPAATIEIAGRSALTFRAAIKIRDEYNALSNTFEKAAIEQRFGGRKAFLSLLDKLETEIQSKEYIKSNTKPCPTCGTNAEKIEGCNHITCGICHHHWCWKCGGWINASDPYSHFNTEGEGCFQKLFDVQEEENMT